MLFLHWRLSTLVLLVASSLLAQQGTDPALSQNTVLCEMPAGPAGLAVPTRLPRKPFIPPKSATLSITMRGEGDFVRSYACADFDPEALAALTYAAERWIDQLKIAQPLSILTCFSPDLPEGTLAVASAPTTVVTGPRALGREALLYPQAILEALDGYDTPDKADMTIVFNSGEPFFYEEYPFNTPTYQYDFISLALHEIAHGLGFFGLAKLDGEGPRIGQLRGVGADQEVQLVPTVFDRAVMLGDPDVLSVLDLQESAATLEDALLGRMGGLFFDAGTMDRFSGPDERTQLYTPEIFRRGSSYSHVADPDHLMSHNFTYGTIARRDLGPTAGILGALGWAGEVEVAAPVEWTAFSGSADGSTVNLHWSTATETDNAGFTVQHSDDGGRQFSTVGSVAGMGTTTRPQDYAFSHIPATAGPQYYRLLQEDYDGTTSVSDVVAVTVSPDGVGVGAPFPNPVPQQGAVSFSYQGSAGEALLLRLHAVTGKLAYAKDVIATGEKQLITIPSYAFTAGMYILTLGDGQWRATYRLRAE